SLLHRFFFQAEDGIRDKLVTGVQTCALPISGTDPTAVRTDDRRPASRRRRGAGSLRARFREAERLPAEREVLDLALADRVEPLRSEERRVGKGRRGGRSACVWTEAVRQDYNR